MGRVWALDAQLWSEPRSPRLLRLIVVVLIHDLDNQELHDWNPVTRIPARLVPHTPMQTCITSGAGDPRDSRKVV